MEDDVKQAGADRYAVSQAYRWKAERDKAMQELRQLKEEVEGRLMPKGMEWPRFEDGEPVRIEDTAQFGDDVMEVVGVELNHFGYVLHGSINDGMRECVDGDEYGVAVKRPAPKVLDADGVEIHEGDTVWATNGHGPFEVTRIVNDDWLRVICDDEKNGHLNAYPEMLTHRAPVLAADGKPLHDGDEVWKVKYGSGPYHVQETHREFRPDELTHERPVLDADGAPTKVGDTVWYRTGAARGVVESIDANSILPLVVYRGDSGELYRDAAEDVTHTKPEIDTWERIEEDATKLSPYYYARDVMGLDTDKMPPKESRRIDMMRDLVRRAKALAERDA